MVVVVTFRLMLRYRAGSGELASRMGRYLLPVAVDLHQVFEHVELHLPANVLMWDRVMMFLIFNVIVDIDLSLFYMPVTPGMHWQRPQAGFVQLIEDFTPVARQLFERALIEFGDQCTDAVIQLCEREEDLLSQTCQFQHSTT